MGNGFVRLRLHKQYICSCLQQQKMLFHLYHLDKKITYLSKCMLIKDVTHNISDFHMTS